MSAWGQNAKNSSRAYLVRFCPKAAVRADISLGRVCARRRHGLGISSPLDLLCECTRTNQFGLVVSGKWGMPGRLHQVTGSLDLCDRGLRHRSIDSTLGEEYQRFALTARGDCPIDRLALAGPFLQRVAIGGDRLLEPGSAALARAERLKRVAEIVLRYRPLERHALAS